MKAMVKTSKARRAGMVRVTFTLPAEEPAAAVSVVGDFNDWDPYAHPLRVRSNRTRTRSASVTVPSGSTLRFRYLAEGGRWFDDDTLSPGKGEDAIIAVLLLSLPVGPELIERAMQLREGLGAAGGLSAVERFIGTRRGLSRADRDLVLDWAGNNVRGVFEVRGIARRDSAGEAVIALNLVDDLDYRVYGRAAAAEPGGFFAGTVLPLTDDDSAWLAAGDEIDYPKADSRRVARLAIDLATREPDLVFRNQDKATQGWSYMRRDREEFVAFFGGDELVLPTLEAEGRLNAYYKMRRDSALAARGRHRAVSDTGETTFVMPEGFFEFDTVGIIYDELDGFVVVPEYGMLRELFADPALAADPLHGNVLRAYLREDSIPPLPLRRMAAAFPGNVDAVFRRVLGNRNFTWTKNGVALLTKRKPGYYEAEPTPGVAVLSDRVMALARGTA